jgi:TM2 domain-containing membrane protein YozV
MNPWVFGLSMAALGLAPTLHSAVSAETKAPATKEVSKTEPAKTEASTPEKNAASDKPAVEAVKTDKAEDQSAAKEAQTKKASSGGHKSKALAGGLAFFPGVAIHGAGHMYAGSWMKGFGLLAIEGVAIGGLVSSTNGIIDDSKKVFGNDRKTIPTDLSGFYVNLGIATVSSMAILWTWFDDMAGAPIAVSEYNKLQDQNATAQFRVAPRGDGAEMALSTNF